MKTWRHIVAMLQAALVACIVASCGGRADRPSLVALDSLILTAPDSALAMLESYPADSLTTADDCAYHALLTTIARYKSYVTATSDSTINIALSHYDHDGADADHRMRSLLYKGCVMEELGNPEQAMEYLKRAEHLCPGNDHFHQGYIHYQIANLYSTGLHPYNAITHYKDALGCFKRVKSDYYCSICANFIGEQYITINIDSARTYTDVVVNDYNMHRDSAIHMKSLINYACIYSFEKRHRLAHEYAINALEYYCGDTELLSTALYISSESLVRLGLLDSAKSTIKCFPRPESKLDSMQYYQCLADIAKAEKSSQKAIDHQQIPDKINMDFSREMRDNSLQETEKLVDNQFDTEHQENLYCYIIFCCVVIFVFVLLILYYAKRKEKVAKSYKQELERLKEKIEISIEKYNAELLSHNKKIEQIESQNLQSIAHTHQAIDSSLECFSMVMGKLLNQYKFTAKKKNEKISQIMDDNFFATLRTYINLRYNKLVEKLYSSAYSLNEEEINIICLELCKFPNAILWTYSNCINPHSLFNKKKIIAKKVNNASSIKDIPNMI